jgi:regulator of protease activity HflC (stomatin/prohibitin superfamily)
MRTFEQKFLLVKKWSNLVILPLGIVLLIIALFINSVSAYIFATLAVAWGIVINCIWFVPTGNVGFKRVLSKLDPTSFTDGINRKIPFVTETFLMDVTVQTKDIEDDKKVLTRNNIHIKATFTFQLEEKYAYLVFRMMGANYYTTHVAKWVDATFDTMVSKLTYPHFQAMKAQIEGWASKLVEYELAQKSSDMTEELLSGTTFKTKEYVLEPVVIAGLPVKETIIVGDGETEEVQKFNLNEKEVELKGVNLFKNISIKINEIRFEDSYEDARAKVAVRKAEVVETTLKAEKARIAAQGIKDAGIIKAEGQAKEIDLVETMKNMKAKELGEYMMRNPYMLKKILAENFPKVFGGANPVINLDDMLGIKPITQ